MVVVFCEFELLLCLELLLLFLFSEEILLQLVQLGYLVVDDLVMVAAAGVGTALDAGC